MLKAVLVSPQFLFITPAGKPESKESIVLLDDYQLASRLSYFLWSAPPDAALAALADKGELHKPEILRAQVERLLKDCLLYTSPSPRDRQKSRMPSSA